MTRILLTFAFLAIWSAQGAVIEGPLQVSCPLLFCPDAEGCTKFEPTTLNISGRQCMGCPKCADLTIEAKRDIMPVDVEHQLGCPMFKCAAPKCEHWEWEYSRFDGLRCRTCPVCVAEAIKTKKDIINLHENIIECPFVDCAYPGPCVGGTITHSYMTWNGQKCLACSACSMVGNPLILPLIKRQIPIDLGHLLRCPMVDCAFNGLCAHTETSYFDFNGRHCPGCPVCSGGLPILEQLEKTEKTREVVTGEVLHLNICPMVMCALLVTKCDQPFKTSTMMWQGKECPGCRYCATEKREVVTGIGQILNICPIPMCVNPGRCDHAFSTSYSEFNGKKCPMCSYCDNTNVTETKRDVINTGLIHLQMCPMPMCMNPGPCDHPYNTSIMMMGNTKCPMCPYCAHEKSEITEGPIIEPICPLLPCPFIANCLETKMSKFEHYGVMCQGCPICTKFAPLGTHSIIN